MAFKAEVSDIEVHTDLCNSIKRAVYSLDWTVDWAAKEDENRKLVSYHILSINGRQYDVCPTKSINKSDVQIRHYHKEDDLIYHLLVKEELSVKDRKRKIWLSISENEIYIIDNRHSRPMVRKLVRELCDKL